MAYSKPYTFRAGTPAKSAEVNANFDTLKDFVNELLTTFQQQLVALQAYNKANLGGSSTQVFEVADGTNTNDAVNKGQLDTVASGVNSLSGRVTTLENAGSWTPPSYSNYDSLDTAGTFSKDGVVYLTNTSTVDRAIYLNGTYFAIRPTSNMFIPVKAGTTYQFDSNIATRRLFY